MLDEKIVTFNFFLLNFQGLGPRILAPVKREQGHFILYYILVGISPKRSPHKHTQRYLSESLKKINRY